MLTQFTGEQRELSPRDFHPWQMQLPYPFFHPNIYFPNTQENSPSPIFKTMAVTGLACNNFISSLCASVLEIQHKVNKFY